MQNIRSGVREEWMDRTRSLALLLVILTHAAQLAVPEGSFLYLLLLSLGRLGVPLFLCLTGALILEKPFETGEDVKRFYKHNLLPLFVVTEIWNVIYMVALNFSGHPISFNEGIGYLLFFHFNPMPNFWYLPTILGIYLALPFVGMAVQKFSAKALALPMAVVFFGFVLIPTINGYMAALGRSQLEFVLDLSFLGGLFGLSILAGFYLNRGLLEKVPAVILALIVVLGVVFSVFTETYLLENGESFDLWYDNLGVFVAGLALFELLHRTKKVSFPEKVSNAFEYLSKTTLPTYLIHILILRALHPLLKGLPDLLECLLLWVLGLAISQVLIFLIRMLPFPDVPHWLLGIKKNAF